jgi:predicted dehydrogenase
VSQPIPVAVIGVGYLGRFHAQKYHSLPACRLIGVLDIDPARARLIADEFAVEALGDLDALLPRVRAVSVAVPTGSHHAIVRRCLEAGVHVLVEKPIASTAAEGRELVELAEQRGLILQVGYLERFNPAFRAARPRIRAPRFIEAIRIASFKERGIDVDVVLDLMSHDLDLVLAVVAAPVRALHAVGVSVITPRIDLANARILFEDGAVANLTASRISAKAERKLRVFQRDTYFSLDLAAPSTRIFTVERAAGERPQHAFHEEAPCLEPADALLAEIAAFVEAVRGGAAPAVTGRDGLAAIELSERISADIGRNDRP